ncbi:helix-turn-helix domain-containing protein [Vibrio cionasavignyae]|uniref:helix-turn-helix domain-containing protein n=1 Tax=Vibrio cionasavignyae TaxID=2910252 RepID=UPI003D1003E6
MNVTNELLDRVKAKYGLTSDYQLCKKLGVSTSRVGNYRSERSSLDWDIAFQIADMLQVDDQYVVYGLLKDKYKNPRINKALQEGSPA